MAKQIITQLLDDLDGGEADETVSFALDGVEFSIDLSTQNAAELRKFLSRFQEAGTRIGRFGKHAQVGSYRTPQSIAGNREENQKIRTWAINHGYEVNDRGRISQDIVAAYRSGTPHPAWEKAQESKNVAEALKSSAVATSETKPPAQRRAAKKAPAAAFKG